MSDEEITKARDDELRDLIKWLREVNASGGDPDPALEQLLRLIEVVKPHRSAG